MLRTSCSVGTLHAIVFFYAVCEDVCNGKDIVQRACLSERLLGVARISSQSIRVFVSHSLQRESAY